MACNVRDIERSIRIVLRIVLLAVGACGELPTWGSGAVLVVGPVALDAGAIGFCPVWTLLGVNACPPSGGR